MPRRTSKASPAPATASKKPRTRGVNLKDLGKAIAPDALAEGLGNLAEDVPLATPPGESVDQCPNLTMTQPWDTARVGVKGASQATQDSDASSSDGEYL